MKIILFLLIGFLANAQVLELDSLSKELINRQAQVEEFQFIKKAATQLGITDVYMFGGTAAAWAHYVRWDLLREAGQNNFSEAKFNYKYINIFRSNQDFDLVIKGTLEQAKKLEKLVQEKFDYFSGTRPTWEVRILDKDRGSKESLLSKDFQNQHTDSHSTGLIQMLDCHGSDCIKDVRDFSKGNDNQFLRDVLEAKLHFYYSPNHKKTSRYKNGLNPEIISVIRFFTKVVQYELEIREEDSNVLKKIINSFNPAKSIFFKDYVLNWLEKNSKKLIVNAYDIEKAQKLIEDYGLKSKLLKIGNQRNQNSMSWWLNKEALKSYPIGQGKKKKASAYFRKFMNEDGHIILAHETNSFEAYESITKSHSLAPNVLTSREGINGENAYHGQGHYTRIGRNGARGTGLTIRYILNPESRLGSDFATHGDYVVVKNKNALKILNESFDMSLVEYFELIANGFKFNYNDKGVLEKLRRDLIRESQKVSVHDIADVESIVLKNPENKFLLNEWVNLIVKGKVKNFSTLHSDSSEEVKNKILEFKDHYQKHLHEKGLKFGFNLTAYSAISVAIGYGLDLSFLGNTGLGIVAANTIGSLLLGLPIGLGYLSSPQRRNTSKQLRYQLDAMMDITNKIKNILDQDINQDSYDYESSYQDYRKRCNEIHHFQHRLNFSKFKSLDLLIEIGDEGFSLKIEPNQMRAYSINQYKDDIIGLSDLIRSKFKPNCNLIYNLKPNDLK